MNPKDTQPVLPVPSVDAGTIHLIIKSAVILAQCALASGIFLSCFVLFMVNKYPEVGQIAAVIMTAAAGLVGVPAIVSTALLTMLARTRTDPPAPVGTPDNPIAVQGTTNPDATPVNTEEVKPDA